MDPLEKPRQASQFFHSLLPTFLLPTFLRSQANTTPRKLHSKSYLDGLRGVGALFVVFQHYAYAFTLSTFLGWHGAPDADHNWLLQLPLIRVFHSGAFMVKIFFVISGYVLSYRGLKLAHEGKSNELLESLSSSVFRRWLRLFLPVIASTFLAFLAARLNLWTKLEAGWDQNAPDSYIFSMSANLPISVGTFTEQLLDWYTDTKELCDPLLHKPFKASKYNVGILWSIPVEWMGSMLVFITVLGIARLQCWIKIGVLSCIIVYCHHSAHWEQATFLSGVLLAELSFIRFDHSPHPAISLGTTISKKSTMMKCFQTATQIFWTFLFLFSIHAGSMPLSSPETTPGFRSLMWLTPSSYLANGKGEDFWPSIASGLLVLALDNAPYLQNLFTTRFAQYLGYISFSLYMLHFMVIATLGTWLVPKTMAVTGGWSNGQPGFVAGLVLLVAVTGPVTFWISDVFTREVDVRCVRFARWIGERCLVKQVVVLDDDVPTEMVSGVSLMQEGLRFRSNSVRSQIGSTTERLLGHNRKLSLL